MERESIDDEERRRLMAIVLESDEVIAVAQDSPDPVVVRGAVQARLKKGVALRGMRRFAEAVAVWDELLATSDVQLSARLAVLDAKADDLHSLGAYEREMAVIEDLLSVFAADGSPEDAGTAAQAVARKLSALHELGRIDDLLTVTSELVDRFGAVPGATEMIATALRNAGMLMLRDEYPIDAILAISNLLCARIDAEPDESLAACCDVAIVHVGDLLRIGGPSLSGVATSLGVHVAGAATSAMRAGHAAIARQWPAFARAVPTTDSAERAIAAIGPIGRAQRRLRQAMLVADTVLDRVGDSSDPHLQEIAALAHVHRSTALVGLGEFSAGSREYGDLLSGETGGAASAFQKLADIHGRQPFVPVRLGQVADLKSRAWALGRGDEAIARVAYDDSIDALPTTDWQSRIVRLVAGWFRSRGGAEIVVPDHPPEP